MVKCFISHASADNLLAESITAKLREHQYDVWLDVDRIGGGALWEQEIKKGIAQSEVIIVILTPDAVKSDWVKKEIDIARNSLKTVIPILMRDITKPADLKTLKVDDVHYIDFTKFGLDVGMKHLINTLPNSISTDSKNKTKHALIVEDIPAQQVVIQQVLQNEGYIVTIAADLEQAIEQIRNRKFDLVTLDMQLDLMDADGQHGLLLLDELKTSQLDVPVIIISALDWSGKQVRDFLREYQVFDYLPKPFKAHELKACIDEIK